MPITINLDDEAIDFLAARIALKLSGMESSQSVNPPEQNTRRTQTDPVSGNDGWDSGPAEPRRPEPEVPTCQHGPMKLVPAGYSKRTGKPYDAFYACQGPRDAQCKGVQA